MPALGYPFTLTADTPARAAEVQAMFDAVKSLLNGTKLGQDNIQANAIVAGLIAANAVTTPKIANDAVTNAKIADAAVDNAQLADGAVTGGKIADTTIGAGKLNLTTLTQVAGGETDLDNTYKNLVSLTNPPAGTYLVLGAATYTAISGRKDVFTRFDNDATTARSELLIDSTQNTIASTLISQLRTVDGSTSIRVQAKLDSTAPGGGIHSNDGVRTRIEAVKIG